MSEEAAEIIPNPRGVATIKPRDLNTVMRVFAWFDWPITPKMQADSVAELDRQINSPTLKERVKARAILALHKLQDQNMKERHHRENLEAGVNQTDVNVTVNLRTESEREEARDRALARIRGRICRPV